MKILENNKKYITFSVPQEKGVQMEKKSQNYILQIITH